MIKPTVGRVVWYWPEFNIDVLHDGENPLRADICHVNIDGSINISVNDMYGNQFSLQKVRLLQEDDERIPDSKGFCEWMPYQKAVASGAIPPVLHETSVKP